MTVKLGLHAALVAKEGHGADLAALLVNARALADAEEGTVTWYAYQVDDTRFGIFDTFETEVGLQAHAGGAVTAALGEAGDLLAEAPTVTTFQILAAKQPLRRNSRTEQGVQENHVEHARGQCRPRHRRCQRHRPRHRGNVRDAGGEGRRQ